ncbi:MAG TPA: septum formation initiator family protein [Bacteroidia bacterium]|jgi:cell division protein DivIC|nr:septum formation initiator family protein [Bacteroidia bacterium]
MLEHLKKLATIFRNRYLSATLLFLLWITFFDQTSLIYDVHLTQKEKQLKAQKLYYEKQTIAATEQLKELQTNPANLEKFAREKYFMKKANEDVYVFVDEHNHLLDTLNIEVK